MPHSFLSAATVATIGLTCKAVLKLGLCSMTVNGLPILLDALESDERAQGRGVVTGMSQPMRSSPAVDLTDSASKVSNHISTYAFSHPSCPFPSFATIQLTRALLQIR